MWSRSGNGLAGEALGMFVAFLHSFGVVGPTWRKGRVSGCSERGTPLIPTVRQQPETMNEDDRRQPRCIGCIDCSVSY
jgi:hypothetical protein